LVFGQVRYDHCGPTALIIQPKEQNEDGEEDGTKTSDGKLAPLLWIEGESDDSRCRVRDGVALSTPIMAEGSLLSDILSSTKTSSVEESGGGIRLILYRKAVISRGPDYESPPKSNDKRCCEHFWH
jgi:hypothetical protein